MNSQGQQRDRRTTTRAALGRPVRLQFDDSLETENGTCENISTGGMLVACEAVRPAGSLVRFELQLGEEQVVRGLGEVIWLRSVGSRAAGSRTAGSRSPASRAAVAQTAGLGIQFRFLEKSDRQQILKLLSEEIKRRLENMPLAVESAEQGAETSHASRHSGESADRSPLEPSAGFQSRAEVEEDWRAGETSGQHVPADAEEPQGWHEPEGERGSFARGAEDQVEGRGSYHQEADEFDAALADLSDEASDPEFELPERVETTSVPLGMPSEPIPDPAFDSLAQEPLATAAASPTAPRLSRLRRPKLSAAFSAETHRTRWLWIAVAAVVLAVLVGWWLARSRQADDLEEPAEDAVEVSQNGEVSQERGATDGQLIQEGSNLAPGNRVAAARSDGDFTRLDDISWQANADGGLRVVLRANGDIPQGNVGRFRMTGAEPREGIVLRGARQRFGRAAMNVGGPRVSQIRTGLHRRNSSNELHVVFDLLEPIGARPALTFRGDKLEVLFPPL